MRLTCWSCRHAVDVIDLRPRFYCLKHRGPCVRRCPDFDYEPGSDERERIA